MRPEYARSRYSRLSERSITVASLRAMQIRIARPRRSRRRAAPRRAPDRGGKPFSLARRDQHIDLAPAHLARATRPSSRRAPACRRRTRCARAACRHIDRSPARVARPAPRARPPHGRRRIRPDRARRTRKSCGSRRRAVARAPPRRCCGYRACAATLSAADFAQASAPCETSGARTVLPLSGLKPARLQPIVPLRSATTLFGTPALISDCAPMIERVRPAQLTTTSVSGLGAMSCTRSTSSAPGTFTPVGIETRKNSSNGREFEHHHVGAGAHQRVRVPRPRCSACRSRARRIRRTPCSAR